MPRADAGVDRADGNVSAVTSRDGTRIAYRRTGSGPAVILVDGALCYSTFGPSAQLAPLLSRRFTVFAYDRRGRGESGDAAPYTVEREIEDLDALIREAGGKAMLFGVSSGAVLALDAAARLHGVDRLALYEPPFIVDDTREPITGDYWQRISDAVRGERRGEALKLFLTAVGVPRPVMFVMRLTPLWRRLKGVAHTLPYDGAIVWEHQRGRPLIASHWRTVTAPTLVMDGGKSPSWMRNGARALAAALPNATHRTLAGQTHMVHANVHAPVLEEFFTATLASPAGVPAP